MAYIIRLPRVDERLAELFEALYSKGYFAFEEDAKAYVDGIIGFMYSIPNRRHYKCRRNKYGLYYCRYKPSH